jgi:hypothetical protein
VKFGLLIQVYPLLLILFWGEALAAALAVILAIHHNFKFAICREISKPQLMLCRTSIHPWGFWLQLFFGQISNYTL